MKGMWEKYLKILNQVQKEFKPITFFHSSICPQVNSVRARQIKRKHGGSVRELPGLSGETAQISLFAHCVRTKVRPRNVHVHDHPSKLACGRASLIGNGTQLRTSRGGTSSVESGDDGADAFT